MIMFIQIICRTWKKSNGLGTNEPKIFPLTGISNSVTTFDNEQGFDDPK